MAHLEIKEELEVALELAASSVGLTKEELAEEILGLALRDESLPLSAFTEEQLSRLMHSIEQVKRGELVPSEEIERKFESWFKEMDAR